MTTRKPAAKAPAKAIGNGAALRARPPRAPRPARAPEPTPPSEDELTAAHEQRELRRGSTPLAIVFQKIGCQLATEHAIAGSMFPGYLFHAPCISPLRKDLSGGPDQDCRDCGYCRVTTLGAGLPLDHATSHRYPGHGAVFPVRDGAVADAIVAILESADGAPLQAPHRAAHYERQRRQKQALQSGDAAALKRRQQEEQHQAGRHGQIPIRP